MKNSTIKFLSAAVLSLCGIAGASNAQTITPSTTGVVLTCKNGTISLGAPASGTTWEVFYDISDTSSPSDAITVDGSNNITGTDVKTGYYYIMSKNTSTNCISEAQKLPVYALEPLALNLDADDYCAPQASGTTFTSSITSQDSAADPVTNIVYQWYTVSGSTETKIATNSTSSSFVPTNYTSIGTQTFRLKAAYTFGGKIYCPQAFDATVTINQAPSTPTITIDQSIPSL